MRTYLRRLLPPSTLPTVTGMTQKSFFDDGEASFYRVSRAAGQDERPGQAQHVLSCHEGIVGVRARFGDHHFRGVSHPGALSLCPAGATSAAAWDRPLHASALLLSPALCERLLDHDHFGVDPLFHFQDPAISQILALLSRDDLGVDNGRLFRDSLVAGVVARLGTRTATPARTGVLPNVRLSRFRGVFDYIEGNLAEDIPLAALAALAGLSEHHFCSVFAREVGVTPHRHVIERRVERAKTLLRAGSSSSVTDIALEVGFSSSAHFSTMFRKATGITPTSYRASHRKPFAGPDLRG